MKKLILITVCLFSFIAHGIPIPKNNVANFDIIRKNKIIGSAKTTFTYNKIEKELIINTLLEIEVKVLFIPAYKFLQKSKEIWKDGKFTNFEGYTNFEDEREYFITGEDRGNMFIASGMDGQLELDADIIPLNYLNKEILNEKNVFDTQKGIVREINVKYLGNEKIKIGNIKIITEKYSLDATSNPKDKGPFPQYTLWYAENNELVKFKFTNWKDKKEITTIRNDWINN